MRWEAGHFAVIGLHLLCLVAYSCMMLVRPYSLLKRVLWLLLIWGVPILGIGLAGSRFTHLRDDEHNS